MERKHFKELELMDELRDLKSDYEIAMQRAEIERIWRQEEVRRLTGMVGKCGGCGTYGELKRDKKAGQYLVMCPYCGRSSQGATLLEGAIKQWNLEQDAFRKSREVAFSASGS